MLIAFCFTGIAVAQSLFDPHTPRAKNDVLRDQETLTLDEHNRVEISIDDAYLATGATDPDGDEAFPHTIWHVWTAPADGVVTIEGTGSQYDHWIGVYRIRRSDAQYFGENTATSAELVGGPYRPPLVCHVWSGQGTPSQSVTISFPVVKGLKYAITYRAAAYTTGGHVDGAIGRLSLSLNRQAPFDGRPISGPYVSSRYNSVTSDHAWHAVQLPQAIGEVVMLAYPGDPMSEGRGSTRSEYEPKGISAGEDYGTLWWKLEMPYQGTITLKNLEGIPMRLSAWRTSKNFESYTGSYSDRDSFTFKANAGETIYLALAPKTLNLDVPYGAVTVSTTPDPVVAQGSSNTSRAGQPHEETAQTYYNYFASIGATDAAYAYYYYYTYLAQYADLMAAGDTAGATWAYYTGVAYYHYYATYRYWPNYANYQLYLNTSYAWYHAYLPTNASTASYYLSYFQYYADSFYYQYTYYGY